MDEKLYTGSCYIGAVGNEFEIGECRDSIQNMQLRQGDVGPYFIRATKGYEARQTHFNKWLNDTDCDFMLLLDSDMVFPAHTLERLRSHGLPYLSGAYMRRTFAPPAPVWFEPFEQWPYRPWTMKVEENKLYKVGASGWGCILVHRDVAEAVRPLLKGEDFVLEDDMDLMPYDLNRITAALDVLDNLTKQDAPAKALADYVGMLREEIKPLRATKDTVGSDIRFPYFAKLAGFDLVLDTGVMCGHMVNYPITPSDFINTPDSVVSNLSTQINKQVKGETKRIAEKKRLLDVAKPINKEAERDKVKRTRAPHESGVAA